jgi:ATP-dependent DNA helicase RecG
MSRLSISLNEMAPIEVLDISEQQVETALATEEGHFSDVKAIEIAPAKLTRTLSAFANADGGELFIGIEEKGKRKQRSWRGFPDPEAPRSVPSST